MVVLEFAFWMLRKLMPGRRRLTAPIKPVVASPTFAMSLTFGIPILSIESHFHIQCALPLNPNPHPINLQEKAQYGTDAERSAQVARRLIADVNLTTPLVKGKAPSTAV